MRSGARKAAIAISASLQGIAAELRLEHTHLLFNEQLRELRTELLEKLPARRTSNFLTRYRRQLDDLLDSSDEKRNEWLPTDARRFVRQDLGLDWE